jgi:signal transduction histidine kinase
MPELVWYRSLYWRIAFGFVALLATLLVVQGAIFLWMSGRADLFPVRSSGEFATGLASDLSAALAEHPDLDISGYVAEQYSRSFRSFVVVTQDGRNVPSLRFPPPASLTRAARGRLTGAERFVSRRGPPSQEGPSRPPSGSPGSSPEPRERGGRDQGLEPRPGETGRGDGFGRGGRGGGRGGRGGPGGSGFGQGPVDFADIFLDGALFGVVAVPREGPPWPVVLRDLGPTLGLVALALLALGTAVAAFAVFGPTRKRLSQLQDAVRSVGAGDYAVRAPETGGDEVTSLSRSFNEMAGQLEERTRALDAADRTRRQLLADVSHELMTPLAAIRGYVETLGMDDLQIDDTTRRRYLSVVNDEAGRLEHIIGDLLDLARFEGGGGRLIIEPVAIEALLERVRHRHAPVVADKNIALATARTPEAEYVIGDQNRLEQALQNLVANAVRHTPAGGTVTVRAEVVGDDILLSVEDTGPGIPPEHLPRVFDRFYKVDESRTGTTMPSGSGLGLSIVQAIIARHGGSVTALNRPEGGARFEIRLPKPAHAPSAESIN